MKRLNLCVVILISQQFNMYSTLAQETMSNIKPSPRWANECVLLADKGALTCFGGELNTKEQTSSMYLLDLAKSWNTSDPAWSLLSTNDSAVPATSYFAATYLKESNRFFIDGGLLPKSIQNKSTSLLYDTIKSEWKVPSLKGSTLTQRKQHTAVSDDGGQIWLWGGLSDITTNSATTTYYNEFTVINSQNWTVMNPIVENNPPPRIDHTATMISNKYILIIGGVVYSHDVTDPAGQLALNPVSMSSLILFDIANNKWINITAGGNIPAPRRGHSAVLSNDSKSIIIFGGGSPESGQAQLNDVFILELETMRWTAPSVNGVPPKPRKYHKAYLVGEMLLVVFGLGGDNKGFDDVNILSTSSWSWITQYNPNAVWLSGNGPSNGVSKGNGTIIKHDPNSTKSDGNSDVSSETRIKAGVIAGVVSGGVVILGGGIFLVLSLVLFKRKKVKATKKTGNKNIIDPDMRQDNESTISDLIVEPTMMGNFQKPDNRSSICYAIQLEDGEYYKPNARNDD